MKYYININQIALEKTKLDIIDAAIFDYLKDWCSVDDEKAKRLTITEASGMQRYTWINFQHLIDEMPLLKINDKGAISRRIDKIEKAGYIKKFQAPDNSLYVRLTDKCLELSFKNTNEDKNEGVLAKNNASVVINKQGVDISQQHNYNTSNYNTNDYGVTPTTIEEDFTFEKLGADGEPLPVKPVKKSKALDKFKALAFRYCREWKKFGIKVGYDGKALEKMKELAELHDFETLEKSLMGYVSEENSEYPSIHSALSGYNFNKTINKQDPNARYKLDCYGNWVKI
jgi:DNA-binding MarR family transcriptional regulator